MPTNFDNQLANQHPSEQHTSKLFQVLKEMNHPVSMDDMLLKTGLSLDLVEIALEDLLNHYHCSFQGRCQMKYAGDFSCGNSGCSMCGNR